MASQKRTRAASGPAKAGSTARAGRTVTRTGSSGAKGRDRTTQNAARSGQAQNARGQNNRGQNNPGQNNRGQNGRGPNGRDQNGRGPGGRPGPGRPVAAAARSGTATAELAARPRLGVHPSPARWFQFTTLILSLAALGVSIYLTVVHYGSSGLLVCSDKGTINCEKVITSPESMVFGVLPVAVLGLAFYVFMVAINTPWAWQLQSRLPLIWWARLGGIITGIGFVLYLIYAEVVQIGNICLWCTSVHAITFLLFVLIIFQATLGGGATARDAR